MYGPIDWAQLAPLLTGYQGQQPGPAGMPAGPGGLSDAQRRYMDTTYAGKWDPEYWTPERFVSAFGADPETGGPTGPVYPSAIPYSTPTAGMGAAMGAMMGGGIGTAGQPVRDIKKYGFGPEHAFFSGYGNQPYGLASIMAGAQAGQPQPPATPNFDSLVQLMRGRGVPGIEGGA